MTRSSSAVPIFVVVAVLLSVILSFFSILSVVSAEDAPTDPDPASAQPNEDPSNPDAPVLPDDAALLKMKVRELKSLLEKKGPDAACLACTSKREYVDRIRETAHWPAVETPAPAGTEDAPSMEELRKMFAKGRDPAQMEKLKENLRAAGIDTSNIFSAQDFDSDRFAEQFKGWKKDGDAGGKGGQPKEDPKPDL